MIQAATAAIITAASAASRVIMRTMLAFGAPGSCGSRQALEYTLVCGTDRTAPLRI